MVDKKLIIFLIHFFFIAPCLAQEEPPESSNAGWFSLGARNTLSSFSHDGAGLGTGGQFRIQFSSRVNSDWFADYIVINESNKVRSEYYHIGWSILYYPIEKMRFPKLLQPYIVAGHCFDYNRKSVIQDASVTKSRWGSAIQTGLGCHLNLTERFDLSLTAQYMIHLTHPLEAEENGGIISIVSSNNSSLEGHLLATVSINYKVFKLWR